VLATMTILFVVMLAVCVGAEQSGNPALTKAGADQVASATQPGGNMEGKELRFGITNSALWATATTAASNGSVNSMHDSFTPLGGLVPLWLIQFQEVIFGGVGSGLYGMLIFAIIGVFVAGLMIGRTPEYLGKKIGPAENKMIVVYAIVAPLALLPLTALAVVTRWGLAGLTTNGGPHGFTEILFAYASSFANNGQTFAGLSANSPFYNLTTAVAMLAGRFGLAVPALALAGLLARQGKGAVTIGILRTDSLVFGLLLVGSLLIMTALSYLPALALGPILEQLSRFQA
jgi:K+-transporting ATPase ATPase A chain